MSLTFETRSENLTQESNVDGVNILVVEDSEDIRALLGELLGDEGYIISFANNGEEALVTAQTNPPGLILMDLSLPGLDGWETVRRLRQLAAFDTTPIIALTAHATKRDEERALDAGCSGYIAKPFDADRLLEVVAGFLLPGEADGPGKLN